METTAMAEPSNAYIALGRASRRRAIQTGKKMERGFTIMKRFISILLALMLFVAIIPATAFAASTKTVYISRNGEGTINLRKGPGYDYAITGSYAHHNNKVTVKKTSGKWSKVTVNATGKTGWIRTYYIDGTTKKLGTGVHVIKKSATVYATAKSSAAKKGKVVKGDTVKVYYTERDYAKVAINGVSGMGWIPMSCIGGVVDPTPDKPSGGSKEVYSTTASALHVRTGPGTSYKIINSLVRGTACTVLEKSGNWRKIKTAKGVTGWVSANYLKKQSAATVATRGSNLLVRKGPSLDTAVLGRLRNGAKVTVKFITGKWAYVTSGKLAGYAYTAYLKF